MHERTENNASEIAYRSIKENISAGSAICAKMAGTIWNRTAYINRETGDVGIAHRILSGRPGTKWNKLYSIALNIPQQEKY